MARRRRTRQKKQRNQAILNFVLAGLAVAIIDQFRVKADS